MSERSAVIVVVSCWFCAMIAAVHWAANRQGLVTGALVGAISAAVSLLILGSKLSAPAQTDGNLPPQFLIVAGFLCLGVVLGSIAGAVQLKLAGRQLDADPHASFLSRMSIVVLLCLLPLVFIGGLVTTTDSGMAVPDWPNTFGSNMFLYPLGPRTAPNVFREHAHRLFGTLLGTASIVLAIGAWRSKSPLSVKLSVVGLLVAVVVQGVLGGLRVRLDERFMALIHGLLAQLTVGYAAVCCVLLTTSATQTPAHTLDRKLRFFSTGLLHASILQAFLGGLFRHLKSPHALWTHAGFAVIVMVFAIGAALLARAKGAATRDGALSRLGLGLLIVICVQFLLGWDAFFQVSSTHAASSAHELAVRTVHQTNGAIHMALSAALFAMIRRQQSGVIGLR